MRGEVRRGVAARGEVQREAAMLPRVEMRLVLRCPQDQRSSAAVGVRQQFETPTREPPHCHPLRREPANGKGMNALSSHEDKRAHECSVCLQATLRKDLWCGAFEQNHELARGGAGISDTVFPVGQLECVRSFRVISETRSIKKE